jgi:hypothetical protein
MEGGAVTQAYILKRVPLWPVIKMAFICFLILGIVIGVFYAVLLSMWGALASSFVDSGFGGQVGLLRSLGFVLIPIIAVLYAIFGTIVVAIWVLIYNLIASVVGGIEFVFETVDRRLAAAPQAGASGEGAHVPPDKTITGF